MPVPVVYSDLHRRHATALRIPGYGRTCSEVPDRAERMLDAVTAAGHPVHGPADFGPGVIEAVHTPELVTHLRTAFANSRPHTDPNEPYIPDTFPAFGRRPAGGFAFDVSCPVFAGTWDASYAATQSAVTAADRVKSGERAAYALVRPPGHHAGPGFHGGFCYTNHAAAAARFLSAAGRVAVLDIDYHHGNGTQEIFYRDPGVLVCSLHADPAVDYPYFWGGADERGEGAGEGFNVNVPLPHGTDDERYLDALAGVLETIRRYAPAFLVLSAGFDLLAGDPVPRNGGFAVTPGGLSRVAAAVAGLGLPTAIVQEGGYNLPMLGGYAVRLLEPFGGTIPA